MNAMNDKNSLTVTFYGGVGSVTGANFLIEGDGVRILVDCGLFQGQGKIFDTKNREPFSYDPASINFVFLTHPHIDHVGRMPKLFKEGFRGVIYSTPPAKEISGEMLLDSMGVMEKESRQDGLPNIYNEEDVKGTMGLWKTSPYGEEIKITPNLSVILRDSGHVLGSAMVQFSMNNKKVVFTGDLGNSPSPLLPDAEIIKDANYLVMESVYGDRNHEKRQERKERLEEIIEKTITNGGVLMIPAFSLERTQEILFEVNDLVENKRIPPVPIYLDSPLAIKITGVFIKYKSYFNKKVQALIEEGDDVFTFSGLKKTLTTDESRAISLVPPPKIIIAGSGMSNGGRIIHHEKRYLRDPKNTLLLVGYQSAGSTGRLLQEGAKHVNILGEEVQVNARVVTISGYSAHKDSDDLVDFVALTKDSLQKVFVVMGEPKSSLYLVQRLRDYLAVDAVAPKSGERVVLDMR